MTQNAPTINEHTRARARRWRRLRDLFPNIPRHLVRPETLFLLATVVLGVMAFLSIYALQATTITAGVASVTGTEPAVMQAFAEALVRAHADERLQLRSFATVAASARALAAGQVDLAVVRPDVLLPTSSATVATLRDRAIIILAPEEGHIVKTRDLAGKRLGLIATSADDVTLLRIALAHEGLSLGRSAGAPDTVVALPLPTPNVGTSLKAGQVDAVALVTAATDEVVAPLVRQVQGASGKGKVAIIGVSGGDSLVVRHPELKTITLAEGSLGGDPALPAKEIKTIGTSVLLMARSGLDRGTVADLTRALFVERPGYAVKASAANAIRAPEFDNPTAATTARIPIHPGAIDYYNREQRGFFERYGDLIYLFALLLSGVGSGVAWLRQRLTRERREHVDEVLERLTSIVQEGQDACDPATRSALTDEIDQLAVDAVADLRERGAHSSTLIAVEIALDAARSSVQGRARPA